MKEPRAQILLIVCQTEAETISCHPNHIPPSHCIVLPWWAFCSQSASLTGRRDSRRTSWWGLTRCWDWTMSLGRFDSSCHLLVTTVADWVMLSPFTWPAGQGRKRCCGVHMQTSVSLLQLGPFSFSLCSLLLFIFCFVSLLNLSSLFLTSFIICFHFHWLSLSDWAAVLLVDLLDCLWRCSSVSLKGLRSNVSGKQKPNPEFIWWMRVTLFKLSVWNCYTEGSAG